mmetsp:Transcript_315/g.347  ORF Transcript_315/g.347 Transcript_315/m.347 type:complete len:87 (-) Transcript_315:86-346(-)
MVEFFKQSKHPLLGQYLLCRESCRYELSVVDLTIGFEVHRVYDFIDFIHRDIQTQSLYRISQFICFYDACMVYIHDFELCLQVFNV